MPRRTARPEPTRTVELTAAARACPVCGGPLRAADNSHRVVAALEGLVRLAVRVRRRRDRACRRRGVPLRSEQEGRSAPPQHGFGLDVIAPVGTLRHAGHRSVPGIHAEPTRRGVAICARSVPSHPDRHDELLAPAMADPGRIRRLTGPTGRVALAIDGLRPDVGHEAPWVVRHALGGAAPPARSLLPGTREDLAPLLAQVRDPLAVPVAGVVSGGQRAPVRAIAEALPGVPHQRRRFHHLREAARPIYEADRHAKVAPKKHVRGGRPIERSPEGRGDAAAEAARGPCAAVRSAPTGDGRPPLEAPGPRLEGRLRAVAAGLARAEAEGGSRRRGSGRGRCWTRGSRRRRRPGRACGGPAAGPVARPRSWTRATRPGTRCAAACAGPSARWAGTRGPPGGWPRRRATPRR